MLGKLIPLLCPLLMLANSVTSQSVIGNAVSGGPPPFGLSCPSTSGTVGALYSSALTASGGTPPYTFALTQGTLPIGLTLNAATGAISGTPSSSGASTFTAQLLDSIKPPDSTSAQCSISIAPAPAITSLSPSSTDVAGPAFTLTVYGSAFTQSSTIVWDSIALPTTFVSPTQLTAQVSADLITLPQTTAITVATSGLTSNNLPFTVGETWVQITDQFAVTFGQVDPHTLNSPVSDWQTGIVFADFNELTQFGITDGYIQVLEYDPADPQATPYWVVQNFPIENSQFLAGKASTYTFGNPVAGRLHNTFVAAFQTNRAVPPPPRPQIPQFRPPVMPNPPQPQMAPARLIPFTFGGILIPPPATSPDPTKILPIDPELKRTDSQDALTNENSVEQLINECAPSSVANSMEFLAVKDGAKNVPANKPKSRVAILDNLMGYNEANGTSALGTLLGKANYIKGANLTGKPLAITMHSWGRFCPNASIDPNCPGGQDGDSNKTDFVDFVTAALTAKKDVEVCFAWAAKGRSPAGAHCVFVTAYRFVAGFLTLDYTHDAFQGKRGGVVWEEGGHLAMRIGKLNNQFWYRNFTDRPALITNVITEENN